MNPGSVHKRKLATQKEAGAGRDARTCYIHGIWNHDSRVMRHGEQPYTEVICYRNQREIHISWNPYMLCMESVTVAGSRVNQCRTENRREITQRPSSSGSSRQTQRTMVQKSAVNPPSAEPRQAPKRQCRVKLPPRQEKRRRFPLHAGRHSTWAARVRPRNAVAGMREQAPRPSRNSTQETQWEQAGRQTQVKPARAGRQQVSEIQCGVWETSRRQEAGKRQVQAAEWVQAAGSSSSEKRNPERQADLRVRIIVQSSAAGSSAAGPRNLERGRCVPAGNEMNAEMAEWMQEWGTQKWKQKWENAEAQQVGGRSAGRMWV